MNISELRDPPADVGTVMGIDTSTRAVAFTIMSVEPDPQPLQYGKIYVDGTDAYSRCGDINRKMYAVFKQFEPDMVVVESVVYVKSRSVVIQLANIVGAVMGVASALGSETGEVTPVAWMNYINNPTRDTKEFKAKVRKDFPGKSQTWYTNKRRELRKQRTKDWVMDTYGIDIDDDDVTDSFGVAYYAAKELA